MKETVGFRFWMLIGCLGVVVLLSGGHSLLPDSFENEGFLVFHHHHPHHTHAETVEDEIPFLTLRVLGFAGHPLMLNFSGEETRPGWATPIQPALPPPKLDC